MATTAFIQAFSVPTAALPAVDRLIPPQDQSLLLRLPVEPFSPQEAATALDIPPDDAHHLLRELYARGLVDFLKEAPPLYVRASFLPFLDVFSVAQPQAWASLPADIRRALDDAYLDRYVEGLAHTPGTRPTADEIVPADVLIARVLADDRPLYLSDCDCRALHLQDGCGRNAGSGGASFCLSYRTVPGSYASRGLSRPISRQDAAALIRRADEAGLVHTANPGGICNCCNCCCYLFRAAQKLGTQGFWPRVTAQVQMDTAACISCGLCVSRCPFDVFSAGAPPVLRAEACVGCGLCVNSCPTGALALVPLPPGT